MYKKIFLATVCEFGPVVAFLVTFQYTNFAYATIAIIIATIISFKILFFVEKQVPKFALATLVGVLFFGILSLYYKSPDLYILKDTLLDSFFGLGLLFSLSKKVSTKPYLQILFEYFFDITDKGWRILNMRWGIFCLGTAVFNEYVRNFKTPDFWVYAKVILILLVLIFGFYQFTLARKYRNSTASYWGLKIS